MMGVGVRDNSLFQSVNSNVLVQEDENFVYLLAGKQSQVTTDSAILDNDTSSHNQQNSIVRLPQNDYIAVGPPLFGQPSMCEESRTLYKSEINRSSPTTEDTIAFGSPY
jgi:hypothetical protein